MRCLALVLALLGAALSLQGCVGSGSPGGGKTTASASSGSPQQPKQSFEVPLNAKAWGGGARLAIRIRPVTSSGEVVAAQELVLDTGSSTLAFCDSSLASRLGASLQTDYMSCNMYNPGGSPTGYWGRFYEGALDFEGNFKIDKGAFSIMAAEEGMPCTDGFQGIFGIAFKQLDAAFRYSDMGVHLSQHCPDSAVADVIPPLMHELRQAAGAEVLGIHWSGALGESEGRLYFEQAAKSNPHFVEGSVAGVAALGEVGWYDVDVQEIAVSSAGRTWTASDLQCSPTSTKKSCILDTGTPVLSVPEDVLTAITQLRELGQPLGSLSVTLAGAAGGAPVVLQFDIAMLLEKQWLEAHAGVGIILGLPLWAWYYTVLDIKGKTVTFVSTDLASTSPMAVAIPQDPTVLSASSSSTAGPSTPPAPSAGSSSAGGGPARQSDEIPLRVSNWGGDETQGPLVSGLATDGTHRRLADEAPLLV